MSDVDVVREIYAAMAAKDIGRLAELFSTSIVIDQDPALPWGGHYTLDPVVVRRMAAWFTAGLRTGVLRPTIDTVFAFDEVVQAHRHLESGQQMGKLVVAL